MLQSNAWEFDEPQNPLRLTSIPPKILSPEFGGG